MGFQLTSENYYSDIANYEYMSVSQFKDFAGTYGKLGCEECAMAKIRGKYKEPDRTALLEGSYVDSFYEGTLDKFKEEHAELFRQGRRIKSKFHKGRKGDCKKFERSAFPGIHVWRKTGHNDRRAVWIQVEDQNGQLPSGQSDCGSEIHAVTHKVRICSGHRVSGFCSLLGI